MKEVEKTIFIAKDGKEFEDHRDCKKYEKWLAEREQKTTYWRVRHSPDLTEGRGFQRITHLQVYGAGYIADLWVSDWCFKQYGRPIAFAQGVAPTPGWWVKEITCDEFFGVDKDTVVYLVAEKGVGLVKER